MHGNYLVNTCQSTVFTATRTIHMQLRYSDGKQLLFHLDICESRMWYSGEGFDQMSIFFTKLTEQGGQGAGSWVQTSRGYLDKVITGLQMHKLNSDSLQTVPIENIFFLLFFKSNKNAGAL